MAMRMTRPKSSASFLSIFPTARQRESNASKREDTHTADNTLNIGYNGSHVPRRFLHIEAHFIVGLQVAAFAA